MRKRDRITFKIIGNLYIKIPKLHNLLGNIFYVRCENLITTRVKCVPRFIISPSVSLFFFFLSIATFATSLCSDL